MRNHLSPLFMTLPLAAAGCIGPADQGQRIDSGNTAGDAAADSGSANTQTDAFSDVASISEDVPGDAQALEPATDRVVITIPGSRIPSIPLDFCYAFDVRDGVGNRLFARGRSDGAFADAGSGGSSGPAGTTGAEAEPVCTRTDGQPDGSLTFSVPCSRAAPTTSIRVWVQSACESDASGPDYCAQLKGFLNPCGTEGCEIVTRCQPDVDTPVNFDFATVHANRNGFFEYFHQIDEVGCTARIENCDGQGGPIRLLFGPGGSRIQTLVTQVSCFSVDSPAAPKLYLSDVEVVCGARQERLAFADHGDGPEGTLPAGTFPWPAAIYRGVEKIGPKADKAYVTLAMAPDSRHSCHLKWTVMPSVAPSDAAGPPWSDRYETRGLIKFDVEIPAAADACTRLDIAEATSGLIVTHNPGPDGAFVPRSVFKAVMVTDDPDAVHFEAFGP